MKKYRRFWEPYEVEEPGYDLKDEPFMGPWEWFAVIFLVLAALAIAKFVFRLF